MEDSKAWPFVSTIPDFWVQELIRFLTEQPLIYKTLEKHEYVEKNKDWNNYFINLATTVATKSKDRSTKCGAVIVGEHNNILSTGFNGLCRGVNDENEAYHVRPEKYYHFEHAERNAIFNAARHGVALDGSKIYVTGPPCMDCARGIVQSGISEVYFKKASEDFKTRWKESYERSINLFDECGVDWYEL